MNLMMQAVRMVSLGILVGQIFGCASSRLVNKWHSPSIQSPPLKKMLIIAIRKDETKRRIWEDAFAVNLAQHGLEATASYSIFPTALPDTNQIKDAVEALKFDAILVIRRLPKETRKEYVPGYTSLEPEVHYSFYWPRYWTYYREIEHPAYIDSQIIGIRSFEITTTGPNGRLIWSATSKTPDPSSVSNVQQGIVGLVIEDLVQDKILP